MLFDLKSFAQEALKDSAAIASSEITDDGNICLSRKDGSVIAMGSPDVAMAFEELSEKVGFQAGTVAADIRKNIGGTEKLDNSDFGTLVRAIIQMYWLASESMKAVESQTHGPSTGLANGFAMVEATEVYIRALTVATLEAAERK
ncbi:MAG: hypothetical protein E7422_10720 [Ruminococcaceae bacterium]|nr:hypothetical protein [Oscillospiraceae bacterium]